MCTYLETRDQSNLVGTPPDHDHYAMSTADLQLHQAARVVGEPHAHSRGRPVIVGDQVRN
jgi:hypothetical protein